MPYPHYYSDKWSESLSTPQVAQVQGVYQPPLQLQVQRQNCLSYLESILSKRPAQAAPEYSALARAWLQPLCSSLQVFRCMDGIPLSLLISSWAVPALSLSAQKYSRPFSILAALWTLSYVTRSVLQRKAQLWTQHFRRGFLRSEHKDRICPRHAVSTWPHAAQDTICLSFQFLSFIAGSVQFGVQ